MPAIAFHIMAVVHVVCLPSLKKSIFLSFFASSLNIYQIQTTIFNLSVPVTYVSGIYIIIMIDRN